MSDLEFYLTEIQRPYESDLRGITEFIKKQAPGILLEVGSGGGRITKISSELSPNQKLHLVEINENFEKYLKECCSKSSSLEFSLQDAFSLNFESNSMTAVIFALNSITEMIPSIFVLGEAHRILAPAGGLYFMVQGHLNGMDIFSPLKIRSGENFHFTYNVNRFRLNRFGSYGFQTQVSVLDGRRKHVFHFDQVIPPFSKWEDALRFIGFEVSLSSSSFTEASPITESSPIGVYEAKKLTNRQTTSTQEFLKKSYDQVSDRYDQFSQIAQYKVPFWLMDKLEPFKGFNLEILDLGCANGSIAKCLAQIDIKGNLYGVDFSEEMVGAAKKTNLYRSVICADLTNGFPIIEENVFDVVFMLSFLEFIEDPKILLADVYRSLKPGGKVFLTFEAMQNKETLRLRAQSTPEVSYYSTDKESILNLLDGAGLVVESWDEMVGYVSPSTSMPINYFAIVAVRKS